MLFPEYKIILVIDVFPILFRARESGMDMVDGSIQIINTIGKQLKTVWNSVYCCFDSATSFRQQLCGSYKSNRGIFTGELTPEFFDATEKLRNYFDSKGFVSLGIDGLEADDLIAHVCFNNPDIYKTIVSNDEDLFQVFDDKTTFYRYINKNYMFFRQQDFIDKYRVTPDQWAMVKAIAGCSSDNIGGVVGVGEKTAINYLLNEHISENARAKIECEQDTILKNLTLTKLPFIKINDPVLECEMPIWFG